MEVCILCKDVGVLMDVEKKLNFVINFLAFPQPTRYIHPSTATRVAPFLRSPCRHITSPTGKGTCFPKAFLLRLARGSDWIRYWIKTRCSVGRPVCLPPSVT